MEEENKNLFIELIPSLPQELALEILTRLHYSSHRVSSSVCKNWSQLIQSKDFYYHRRKMGFTHKSACLVQALPIQSGWTKPTAQPRYGISLFDPVTKTWNRVDPVPKYPNGLPLFCQVASTEGKLVVMGGWDPSSWEPVKDVFVYEFTTRVWTRCVDMPSTRSFFAVGAVEGKVIVAGGHDESKNALSTAYVMDLEKNEWTELRKMSEERDECEGLVIGSEFWVVSGYETETQGVFKSSAEVYDFGSGEWRRVDNAWGVNKCPRGVVNVNVNENENGKGRNDISLTCWSEFDPAVQVGACGLGLSDNKTLVTGSAYQGGTHGFFLLDKDKVKGQNGKLVKINVPDEFTGFVQSACCVEI